jgi:PAS domain S-box-containing protein
MLGYESPEETLREVKDIAKEIYIHPERRDEIIRLLKAGARVVNFENLYRRKDGGQFVGNLNVKVMHDKSGQPCFLLGHVEDITRRKQAEEELAFRNAILSTQQEASLDGILVVDEQGRIISFNRRFVEMWEIPGKVIESRSDQQALQSVLDKLRDPKQFLQRINYLYEHRNEKSEEEIELKDGRTFDRYSAPMYGTEGKYYGRIWFFRDVTGRRRTG